MNNSASYLQVSSFQTTIKNKMDLDQIQFRYQDPCDYDENGFNQTIEASRICSLKQSLSIEQNKVNFFKVQQIVKRSIKNFFSKVYVRRLSLLTLKKLFFINDLAVLIEHFPFFAQETNIQSLRPFFKINRNVTKSYENLLNSLLNQLPLFQPNSNFLIVWNSINALLKLALVFIFSFHQFFYVPLCQESHQTIYQISFLIIQMFLLFDMFVNFNKTLIRRGVFVIDKRQIAVEYLKGRFFKDFLSQIPVIVTFFDNISSCSEVDNYFQFTPRFFVNFLIYLMIANFYNSVAQLESQFQLTPLSKMVIKLQRLVFFLLIQSHMVGCFLKLTAEFGRSYLSYETSWIEERQLEDNSWEVQYIYSFYWATTTMLTVGYGDIIPQTPLEVLVLTLVMFLGCGVFGFLINQIGSIISEINSSKQELENESEILTKYLHANNISNDLVQRALSNLEYIHQFNNKTRRQQEEHILNKLSPLINEDIRKQFRSQILKEFSVLNSNFSEMTLNKMNFQEQVTTPEEIITQSNNLFLLAKGSLQVLMKPSKRNAQESKIFKVDEVNSPYIFGKWGFFTDQEEIEYVKSLGFCTLYKVNRKDFLEIIRNNQSELAKFMEIKDELIFNRNFERVDLQCQACEVCTNHQLVNCPFTHLVLNEHLLIKRDNNQKQFRARYRFKRRQKANKTILSLDQLSSVLMEFQIEQSDIDSGVSQEEQPQDSVELIPINSDEKLSIDKFPRKDFERRRTIFYPSANDLLLKIKYDTKCEFSNSHEIDKQHEFENYLIIGNLANQLKAYARYQRKLKAKKPTVRKENKQSQVLINHERRQSRFFNQGMFNFNNKRNLK